MYSCPKLVVYFIASFFLFLSAKAQIITTIAGNGIAVFSGDGGPATNAGLSNPTDVAVDAAGNIYIADYNNHRIRKINPSGIISTFAGTGMPGYSGDGGPAINAQFDLPAGLGFDAAGNLYVVDHLNSCIRKIDPAGIITTVAGTGIPGYSGDGGPATSAQLGLPNGVAFDAAGNMYITDRSNYRIRKVTPSGIISTFAGTGTPGYSGDGGPAISAEIQPNSGIAFDAAGNIYIADRDNYRVRKITTSGIISTVAGTGSFGNSGNGGPATSAYLSSVFGVMTDPAGNLYIAEFENHQIRKISTSGIITAFAGTGIPGYSGDGGPPVIAQLNYPATISKDGAGALYIPDAANQRVRKITGAFNTPVTHPLQITGTASICDGDSVTLTGHHSTTFAWANSLNPSLILDYDSILTLAPINTTTYLLYGDNDTTSFTVSVVQPIPIYLGHDTTLCEGDELILHPGVAGAYLWQDHSTASTFIVSEQGIYWVDVMQSSCSASDTIQITTKDCESALVMPNIFTPNGDGINDFFVPEKFKNIQSARLVIFNRWGQKLLETDNLSSGWNGKQNDRDCVEGAYFWIVEYTAPTGEQQILKGNVTLLR